MKSYSFDKPEISGNRYYEIWSEIERLRNYFRKFCGAETDEAMNKTWYHCLSHFDETKGDLRAYVKSLAKTIVQPDGREVSVDFLENTVDEALDDEDVEQSNRGFHQRIKSDFSDTLIDDMYMSLDRTDELASLALSNMSWFLKLCESIINKDSTSEYYSKPFVEGFKSLYSRSNNLFQTCIQMYEEYGEGMREFLNMDKHNEGTWIEADFTYINLRTSRRVSLQSPTGGSIEYADMEPFQVKGSMKGKKIVRVKYSDQHEMMLDRIDSPVSNEIKFFIGNRYIIRTLGGSVSVVDVPLFNMYTLVQNEILTNLLRDTKNSALLNVGYEYMYFLCKSDYDLYIPKRVIRGIELEFKAEEVL